MKQSLFLALFIIASSLFAQTNVEFTEKNFPDNKTGLKSAQANFEKGDEYFYMGPQSWETALKYYLKANEFNPNNARLNFQIATIYRQFNNVHTAADYYEKAITLDKEYRLRALFPLAEELHLDGQWDKALEMYNEYLALLNSKESNKIELQNMAGSLEIEKKNVNMKINQCNNGKQNVRDSIPIIMLNLGDKINGRYPDYAPVVNSNENLIIFTSRRAGSTGGIVDGFDPFEREDIYFSNKNEDGTWSQAKKITGDVNTNEHDAAAWISPKGDRLIIYRSKDNGELFESEFKNESWSKPTEMKMINSKFDESHACYSPDGNTIYFTTNNPKYATKGGFDICMVTKDSNGKWSEPKEVEGVNTIYNEDNPFIKSDGKTLYFASEGHSSIGGFDIFKCDIINGTVSNLKNVGFPINSTSNDRFIFFTEDGKKAFLDSDRKGGQGEKDIYEMFILDAIHLPLIVEVYDERSMKLIQSDLSVIETAYIPVEIDMKNDSVGVYTSTIGVSKYYTADARADGYLPGKIKFNTKFDKLPDFDTTVIRQRIYLKPTFAPIVMRCELKDKKTLAVVDGEVEITSNENIIAKLQTKEGKCEYRLEVDVDYEVIVIAPGYKMVKEQLRFTKDDLDKTILLNMELDELEIGDKFVLKNIYFDFDRSNLRPESVNELNLLKEFLINNPKVRVELSAHTDNRGSTAYNYALSDSRAKSVMEWLVANGIDPARLVSKGYGFDQPIAPNDTDENRQLNRRVEFKIIK